MGAGMEPPARLAAGPLRRGETPREAFSVAAAALGGGGVR